MIKRNQKNVQRHISLNPEADDLLVKLIDRNLIENASKFIETLVLKYAAAMLQHSSEVGETNLIISEEQLLKKKTEDEIVLQEYGKLSEADKLELNRLTNDLACDGFVHPKDKDKYESFKQRGLIK